MDDKSLLREVLSKARRRCITHLLLDRTALAVTIGMGGAIVLLLAGTQILDWYWIVLLAAVSLGVGVYRLWGTIPSTYKLAQKIDRRLALADALSTAIYFESDPSRGHEVIRNRQHEQAEDVARSVDVTAAVPFYRPKFAYPAIALAAVAFGLFAVRFAVTGTLSLKPSLVQVAFDHFFPPKTQLAKLDKKGQPIKTPNGEESNPDSPSMQNPDAPDQMLDAQDNPDTTNPQAADNSKEAASKGSPEEKNADSQGDKSENGDKQSQGNDASEDQSKQGSKDGKQQQQNAKDGKQGSENQNSSLMDKLKDAMANMMNKMKNSSKDGQQSPQQNAQNSDKGNQDKSKQQNGKQQSQQQSQSDAQSDQQSDSGDKKQSADAKGAEKSSDKNASQDSKSGVGSADGDKSAKEAEQLAAMGKISEILGKRAQNVTGEVMVEVGSSKQQLKTPWAQKQAQHAEAGSEINRDEVPLVYQQYVQQYFEEIRKTPAQPKAPKPATKQ